jgi:hypothetical protein
MQTKQRADASCGWIACGCKGCGKTRRDCHSEEPQAVLSIAKEESRIAMKIRRARFFAEFTVSGRAKSFAALRMTAKDSE